MKQIWPTYAYSPTTNVLTLTGLNIDRDQLLLVTAADRGRIMYNFADSSVTASAFTSGANTALTLVATTAGLTTTAALVIYFDDQATSSTVTGTVELGPTSLNALESITVTMGQVTVTGGLTDVQLRASAITVGGTVTVGNSVTIGSLPAISGTVTANLGTFQVKNYNNVITSGYFRQAFDDSLAVSGMGDDGAVLSQISSVFGLNLSAVTGSLPISGTVTIGSALPAGTNQIGSVTASISGTVPISISSVTVGNSVTIGSLPAISGTVSIGNLGDGITTFWADNAVNDITGAVNAGIGTYISGNDAFPISGTVTVGNSVTIGSLPAISGTVTANTFALQGTAVTTSNFTSTTASTVLANYNATREVLTIFNEGAGQLFVSVGATCTTAQYQVRLSSGDYYEAPSHQTTITHSAVFATAGTARVTEVI
jgi:hypothetical protein